MPVDLIAGICLFMVIGVAFSINYFQMKSIILTVINLILFNFCYAQVKSNETYAIVSIETYHDKPYKTYYCNLTSESVEKYSKELKSLVKYELDKRRAQPDVSFYHEKNDTTSVYFNYFLSTTHAFQFLADHGLAINWRR